MIQVKNLTKLYNSGVGCPKVKALDGISFSLGDRGLTFIVGRSGGGKSTLLNLIGGLDSPSSGEILIDGNRLSLHEKGMLDSYRNTYVGFIFQEFNLIDEYNVEENVALALNLQGKKDKDVVEKCLNKVGLGHLLKRRCSELSGGQKQRVALARALVKEPKLILADEPTGALDSHTGTEIMELLKELSVDNLVVVVSHDLTFAKKFADRIIEIDDGKIANDTYIENDSFSSKPLSFKKPKIGFLTTFLLAFRLLKSKTSSLLTTILLSSFSFTIFGVASAISRMDAARAFASAVEGASNKEIALNYRYSSSLILKSQLDKLDDSLYDPIFYKPVYKDAYLDRYEVKVIDKGEKNISTKPSPFRKVYDISDVDSFVSFNENDLKKSGFTLDGMLPTADGEIAISKVLYDSFARKFGLNTYEGLTLEIQSLSGKQTVVGVIDNHFDETKYSNLRSRDLEHNSNLEYSLQSDLKNSFSSTIYLSSTTYENKYDAINSVMNFSVMNNGSSSIYLDVDVNTTCNSIEVIYNDYKSFAIKRFCNENNLLESEVVEFDFLTRRDFLEEYFVMPKGHKIDELLKNDDQFISLDDDQVILGFDAENSSNGEHEGIETFKNGKDSVESSFNCHTFGINKIKAFFLNSNIIGNSDDYVFKHQAIISPSNYEHMKNNSIGYRCIKVVLSDNYYLNLDFINFFMNIDEFIIWHYSSSLVYNYTTFFNYPVNILFSLVILLLYITSSLILINFISISMSYGKKTMGILRALGAKNSNVLFVYLFQGLVIGFLNGILSLFSLGLVCWFLNIIISASMCFSMSLITLSYFEPLIIFCCSMFLCIIAVAFAVLKNRKNDPIEMVRAP
ncbi:MAG: ABC transporter ATP-binding protein/permease [Bacilli bacterium]|nr:ABC transporter ATP-binding protein/permease [Bacilli bacterium]